MIIKCFNVDINNVITDYKLSYQNSSDEFINTITQMKNNSQKSYTQKVEELDRVLKQISDVNDNISKSREKLQCIANKVESEEQTMRTENDRLITLNDECRLLGEEENELKDLIDQSKMQLTQVTKEKIGNLKKLKRDIKSFKAGVGMYEEYLQLNMNIELQENNSVLINLALKKYNVVLEENDNDFNLLDISPRDQTTIKATGLYNHNKDIQGLLTYLYKSKE